MSLEEAIRAKVLELKARAKQQGVLQSSQTPDQHQQTVNTQKLEQAYATLRELPAVVRKLHALLIAQDCPTITFESEKTGFLWSTRQKHRGWSIGETKAANYLHLVYLCTNANLWHSTMRDGGDVDSYNNFTWSPMSLHKIAREIPPGFVGLAAPEQTLVANLPHVIAHHQLNW